MRRFVEKACSYFLIRKIENANLFSRKIAELLYLVSAGAKLPEPCLLRVPSQILPLW